MNVLYLSYKLDRDNATYRLTGEDRLGAAFGVGAGETREAAEHALIRDVLGALEAHASVGEDRLGALHRARPEKPHVTFGLTELLPIRLRLARSRTKLRQSDMAVRLGITRQAYAKPERPGANPTIRTLVQAEQALGVTRLSRH